MFCFTQQAVIKTVQRIEERRPKEKLLITGPGIPILSNSKSCSILYTSLTNHTTVKSGIKFD